MTDQMARYWWHLGILTMKRAEALRVRYGSLEQAKKNMGVELLRELRCKPERIEQVMTIHAAWDDEQLRERLERTKIGLTSCEDDDYPPLLKQLPDAPMFLSYRGDISLATHPQCISLVGTRAMTEDGMRVTHVLTEVLVRAGFVTVSGMALGVDEEVARETIRCGGKTIAILGQGLHAPLHPERRALMHRIVEHGGLIFSEFPLTMQGGHYTFPARNRIIAGLTSATIVCEAPKDSGAIITADLALDYNRDLYAVPGPMLSETWSGCNKLIADGHAQCIASVNDLLTRLGCVPSINPTSAPAPADPHEAAIWKELSLQPLHIDALAERLKRPIEHISPTLTILELQGMVRSVGGGQWVRQ